MFGVYVDPWHVDDWARAIGAAPQAIAKFEAFSRNRTLDEYAAESARQGIRRMLVSWEPWTPVPAALGLGAQSAPQPGYRNIDIARGAQDRYIMRFARSLARFPGTVWLRYAHEMNGYWYPWSRGARGVPLGVAADRPAVPRRRRAQRALRVVGEREPLRAERRVAARPRAATGRASRYVDAVGSTMIDFGGDEGLPGRPLRAAPAHAPRRVRQAGRAGRDEHRVRRPRRHGCATCGAMLRGMPWVRAVMWSQLPSRGKAHRTGTGGIVDWDVQRDPPAAAELRRIIEDGVRCVRRRVSRRPAARR